MGCSEFEVAADFLVEVVRGGWLADSSIKFIRDNEKKWNSLELVLTKKNKKIMALIRGIQQ